MQLSKTKTKLLKMLIKKNKTWSMFNTFTKIFEYYTEKC